MPDIVAPQMSALNFVREMKAEQNKEVSLDSADQYLFDLAGTSGWKDLKKYILSLKDALKPELDMNAKSDDEMFRSFGMRMVLYELASEQLQKIINRVEDAEHEVERRINKKV